MQADDVSWSCILAQFMLESYTTKLIFYKGFTN